MATRMMRQNLIEDLLFASWGSGSKVSLPFLYCTRTLSSNQTAIRRREVGGTVGRHRRLHATVKSGASESAPHDGEVSAFEKVSLERSGASTETPMAKRSTITKSEQAVFDRIFGRLSDDAKDLLSSDEDLLSRPDPEFEDPSLSPAQQLHKIFEEAIKADRSARASSRIAKPESRKKAGPLRGRDRTVEKVTPAFEDAVLSESEERGLNAAMRKACKAHKRHVIGMIREAKTDVAVWEVLENEVFRLVARQLDPQRQRGEAEKVGSRQPKEEQDVAADAPVAHLQSSQKAHRDQAADNGSIELQDLSDDAVSAIIRHNYGSYCLYALRIYRRLFPYTPYALHVLTQIKSMGPVSTVLGVSSDFYNEVIYHHWTLYGDCGAIAELLEEMENQGLKATNATEKLVRSILRQHQKASQGHKGKALRVWSRFGPVKEKWLRLKDVYFGFVRIEEEEERSYKEPVLEEVLLEGEGESP